MILIVPFFSVRSQSTNPVRMLYQIESQAARSGWTADLHDRAGMLLEQMGDLTGAAAHWEAAQQNDVVKLQRLARAYMTLQYWEDARRILERLLAVDSSYTWAHYELGLILVAYDARTAESHLRFASIEPQYQALANELVTVIGLDRHSGMRLGFTLVKHERWPYAELVFRQIAVIQYPYPEALAYVGLARTMQGKDGSAWLEQALLLGGDVAPVYYLYGLHLRRLFDYEGSLQAFTQAVALDALNPVYYAELGLANSYLFNFEQAEYWLKMAVSMSNNAPEFEQLLTLFYTETGYVSGVMEGEMLQSPETDPGGTE